MDSNLPQYVLTAQAGAVSSACLVLSGILFLAILLCCLLFCLRRNRSIRKIRRMSSCQKTALLNEQLIKFGFVWLPSREIISSTIDAWQREFGYRALFDQTASLFNMVFDCEPVYFDYDGQTWLIELWKGQYGINTGGEIGVYRADRLVPPRETEQAHFESVPDDQMLPLAMELARRNSTPAPVFSVGSLHWWLTGFRMGEFSRPGELVMYATVTFPDEDMLSAFTNALLVLGYRASDFTVYGLTVSLIFDEPHSLQPRESHPVRACIAQLENRLFCRLYRCVTKPFTETPDQLLYLYYLLPPAFTHMLTFRRSRTQKRRKHMLSPHGTPEPHYPSGGATHIPASHDAPEPYSRSGAIMHMPSQCARIRCICWKIRCICRRRRR